MSTTLEDLIHAAEAAGACHEALQWARSQPDWETAAKKISPEWAYWLRRFVADLPPEVARAAERAAMRDPRWAYRDLSA